MLNKKIPFFAMLMHSVFCMDYDTNVVNMSRNAELPKILILIVIEELLMMTM